MDSTGWHASHRARQEQNRWSHPQRGPDGQFRPVEQVYPIAEPFIGGFQAGSSQPTNYPQGNQHGSLPVPQSMPTSPYSPTDFPYTPVPRPPKAPASLSAHGRSWSQTQHAETLATEGAIHPSHYLAHLSAVERSRNLRVARMNPYLQFMVGPLLRYDTVDERGVWHGAVLIVTADIGSVYEPHPTLTYAWDPSRPSDHSRVNSQSSLHATRSSFDLGPHPADPQANVFSPFDPDDAPMGMNAVKQSSPGQEIWVYCGNGGTFTFWRFMIHIPLGPHEMKISYTVNNGQNLHFYVPARDQNMRWAAFSCNGFSAGVNPDDFRGPGFSNGYDPVWTDLLAHHNKEPFHVLVGGGDQLYCDAVVREPEMQEWLQTQNATDKLNFACTPEMKLAIDRFYFNHYCSMFRSGAFARANSTIPMLNMLDDHDLIDGYGSYPDNLMRAQVFNRIGSRGYFFYLLFQCFLNIEVDGSNDKDHPFKSTIIGGLGPYIPLPSHSWLSYMGPKVYILCLDCRAERTKEQVCSEKEYHAVFRRLYELPRGIEHMVLLTGIPIAYPRMVFLENALDSKLNPITALGRNGQLGLAGFVNKFNADAELLDDLNDHWTASSHKRERNWLIEQLQDYARARTVRVSLIGGDVHCAAVGVLKTLVKGGKNKQDVPPPMDFRYMVQVVSSAIVNTPPPNGVQSLVSNLSTKTHRTLHHMDTDETMLPIFNKDTDGKAPKSKYIMGRRNWCNVNFDKPSGALVFVIQVEKQQGYGETVGYAIAAPAPRWQTP